MKRILPLIFFSLLFFSCGNSNGFFKMEGRLLHMNQGELYLYSPDGVIEGLDTIKVEAGRFAFQIPCEKEGTLELLYTTYIHRTWRRGKCEGRCVAPKRNRSEGH